MGQTTVEQADAQHADDGTGPLLERDYVALIAGTELGPEAIMDMVRADFPRFAPPETASFRKEGAEGPLRVGDELNICLTLLGTCRVRVLDDEPRVLTLQTLEGHPEAGRITFACDRDERGRLRFRIRSRTRAGGWMHYFGYLLMGKQMQARCWIRFIKNVARASGGHIQGPIRVETRKVDERPADRGERVEPTFTPGEGG